MTTNHAKQGSDAAKKRREYLRQKVRIYASAVWATGICAACVAYLWIPTQMSHYERNLPPEPNRAAYLSTVITNGFYFLGPKWPSYSGAAILTLVFLLILIVVSAVHCVKQVRCAKAIPYVPPVAEQLAALPAEDILVRGSDQPPAAPGELLRAASGTEETKAAELVRATGQH